MPAEFKRIAGACLILLLASALLKAYEPAAEPAPRPFHYDTDSFAFANETVWNYVDGSVKVDAGKAERKRDYTRRCFVVSRAAVQFWKFARFDPNATPLSPEKLADRIREVTGRSVWLPALPPTSASSFPATPACARSAPPTPVSSRPTSASAGRSTFVPETRPSPCRSTPATEATLNDEIFSRSRPKLPDHRVALPLPQPRHQPRRRRFSGRKDGTHYHYLVYDPNYTDSPKRLPITTRRRRRFPTSPRSISRAARSTRAPFIAGCCNNGRTRAAIVVTGIGAVTPLGDNFPASWGALIAGRDAQGPLELFDTSGCRCHTAASCRLPTLDDLPKKIVRRFSRASRLALPAAREALAHAGLLDATGRSHLSELPISVSTTAGGMAFGEDFARRVFAQKRVHLFDQVSRYLPQQQVLDLQQTLGFRGHSVIIANACASGANAIGHAAALIATGAAECVLTGGFEAITELVLVGFDCLQATSTDKCRPFDVNRSGLMIGEAAAFLVLESAEHAARRAALRPLCRLTGYGHSTDVFHLTQPKPDGSVLIEVMRTAVQQAGIAPRDLGYINAHGTATPANDGVEAGAYATFLGDALGTTRISSTKAAIGHTLGAAGSIEALFAIAALRRGKLPPQLNLLTPIPEIAPALVGNE